MLFPNIARHHAILLPETFGEVAGSCEANSIGHLADTLVGGEQHLVGTLQARGAQQFDR